MYTIKDDKIIITDLTQFHPMHILECGQIFRYTKSQDDYIVYSKDQKAKIIRQNNNYIIECTDLDYFIKFFDLDTDYSIIKSTLTQNPLMEKAIEFGYGIRILNNNLLEMIISFIISANNNIPRIQKSIEYICNNLGDKKGDYYTFPNIESLHKADEEFFKKAGTGYRAKYLVDTIDKIYSNTFDLNFLANLDTNEARKYLLQLLGIGEKVADCILLFGLHRMDVFPVDTWIHKIYNESISKTPLNNRKHITRELVSKFQDLSGYAQQYLFYYRRSGI